MSWVEPIQSGLIALVGLSVACLGRALWEYGQIVRHLLRGRTEEITASLKLAERVESLERVRHRCERWGGQPPAGAVPSAECRVPSEEEERTAEPWEPLSLPTRHPAPGTRHGGGAALG